jgi:hypothetical protein
LEELVPKVKESTGLIDQPDPAAEEVPSSKRSSKRWRWREKGVGGGRKAQGAVHPDAPAFIWMNHWAKYSGPSMDQIFQPQIIRPEVVRIIRPGASLLRKTGYNSDLCAWRGMFCR